MSVTLTLGENTYITLDDANAYFETRLNSDNWHSANESNRERALIQATRKFEQFEYKGYKDKNDQTLKWPRCRYCYNSLYQTWDNEDLDYPREVQWAVCEEALALLELSNSTHFKNQKYGINSISLGGSSVSYNGYMDSLLSPEARQFIHKYLKTPMVR